MPAAASKKTFFLTIKIFPFHRIIVKFLETPEWFLPTIAAISLQQCRTPSSVPITFEASSAAAKSNQQLLEQHDCSISNLIQAYPNSCLSYGSEFRPVEALKPLLQLHPRWTKLANLLIYGSCWPVSKIDDKTRRAKNSELLLRGNHKSATTHSEYLGTSLNKEIIQGWMIPLPIEFLKRLKHAEIAPIGVAQQYQALDDGTRSLKWRMIHDLLRRILDHRQS